MQDISKFKCPYIDKREIWHSAETFRKEFWPVNSLPVDIEKIVWKILKLNIDPKHGLLSDYDIDAYLKSDLTGIVVDYKCYMDERFINRLRFSFAHELGHLFLHKNIYGQFGIHDTSIWEEFMLNIPEKDYKIFEYQANEFAGRVLVPRDRLIHELEECLIMIKEAGLLNHLAHDSDFVLASITPKLRKPFGVSDLVIERRVEREELWPPKID